MKTLFVSDFDGCWNALNVYQKWVGEGEPNELDYIFMSNDKWELAYYILDPELYFIYDKESVVNFFDRRIKIHWSSLLVNKINEVVDQGLVDFVWLTAWKNLGVEVLSPEMGLAVDKCDWLDWKPRYRDDYSHIGKYDAIVNLYNELEAEGKEKPPLIWVEDMSSEDYADEEGQKILSQELGTDVLVIKPDGRYGISKEDLTAIETFLANH